MNLDRLHRRVSFALVLVGTLMLSLSGELALPVWLVALTGAAVAWPRWGPRKRARAVVWTWNGALVAAFGFLLLAALATGNWLLHMIHFGLVMTIAKLYWIGRARDIFQLYALTLLLVLGAAVINPGLSFAALFPFFVVLLTWGLILLHLRRELEQEEPTSEAPELPAPGDQPAPPDPSWQNRLWQTRPILKRRFLLGTSALALAIFASSLVIFFFFPRLGLGFFFAKTRGDQAVSGFGDDLELGHFGTIRDNQTVLIRVELPDEPVQPSRRLRLRGISFDTYDGRAWRKSDRLGRAMPSGPEGFYDARPWEDAVATEGLLRQELYVEPLQTDRRVIFGTPRVRYVRRPGAKLKELQERGGGGSARRLRFTLDEAGDLGYSGGNPTAAMRYTILSSVESPTSAGRSRRLPPLVRERYLQLPPSLDRRVPTLARELVGDGGSPFERAANLERGLQSSWEYSLEGGHDPEDPLADFLFDRQAGHCEYFATAMAVLARAEGLPARVVNGFYGGVWNHYGAYYSIRQADAHSWVEVWIDSGASGGWLTFDPTPARERYARAGSGFLADISAWIDSVRLAWFKWVIEYDLERQIELLSDLFDSIGGASTPFGGLDGKGRLKSLRENAKRAFSTRNLLILGGVIVLIALLRRWRRRDVLPREPKPRRKKGTRGPLRAFARLERAMARQGYPRRPSVSPREWAAEIARDEHPAGPAIQTAARALEAVLWGGETPESARGPLAAALDAARRSRKA